MPTTPGVWKAYYELCKPRVVSLMLLTAIVGMLLATPGAVAWQTFVYGTLGIGLSASSGAVLNHLIEQRIDAIMIRTKGRPIPSGRIPIKHAIYFASIIGIVGFLILFFLVNALTAILTLLTLVGYAFLYTLFLKRVTSQNIVIGGLAGAAPPLLGWTAVTNQINAPALLLVIIIFTWTPPHFWALSIYRYDDYKKANIPMLPVTHGIPFTKLNIVLYTFLLFAMSLLPFVIDMSGLIYLIGAILLGAGFLYWVFRLKMSENREVARTVFRYSIFYLMTLFLFLLVDHYIPILK